MLTLLATIEATGSPSSRRAWIEIVPEMTQIHLTEVALLTEGVDRNCMGNSMPVPVHGRPPHGGRG